MCLRDYSFRSCTINYENDSQCNKKRVGRGYDINN
jgi:hypothetical protein